MPPHIRSVHVALPETFTAPDGTTMTSAVRKRPVDGPVAATRDGLAGNDSAHPAHGGTFHAHVFPHAHYAWFEARAGRPLTVPTMGENLSLVGLDEEDVRVGDVARIGTATLQVTQPTIRCAIPGRAAGLPSLLAWCEERLATGFYMCVLEPGEIRAGDAWEFVRRGPAAHSIANLNRALLREPLDDAAVARLTSIPEVADPWKDSVRRRFARAQAKGT